MLKHRRMHLTLVSLVLLGLFAGCQNGGEDTTDTVEPAPTETAAQIESATATVKPEDTPIIPTATSAAIVAEESQPKDAVELAVSEYGEAPMLAELVAAGELPSVEERLPIEGFVQVIEPVDGVGEYGGTWYNVSWGPGIENIKMITYDPPIRWKSDYTGYEPGLLKSWEISDDGTQITWHFRQGVKWSDGEPFTTDDLRFWWEDMALNEDYGARQVPPWGRKSDGTPMDVSFPDDYTMIMEWDSPQYTTPYHMATGFWFWEAMMKPRHYLEQFHPAYTEGVDYDDLELADKWWETPGYPTLYAWHAESITPGERVVLVRNPYYWKVDAKGNQLPYIDRLDVAIVPDKEVRVLEASQGKYTATFRASEESTDIPFLMDQAEEGGYHLHAGAVNGAGGWPCWIVNQDLNDQSSDEWEEIRDVLRDKRFRQALSHAMDRQRIIDVAWDGIGTPKQGTISPQSWHFADLQGQKVFQEWSSAYVEHDPQLAEQLLDEAGVVDVDRDGWRDLPSGAPFQLIIDVGGWSGPTISIDATLTYADQLAAVGIDTLVNNLIGMPESYLRYEQGLFMLKECHASDLDVWVAPGWVFPSLYVTAWPLVSEWLTSGGVEGVKPTGPARDLLDIYERGLAEPDIDRRHELVWEAIELHIQEGPFFIGASGDQQVPVVIADNFYGVPDLVVLGPWAPGSPGNLHPEQFWIDQ